MQPLIHSRQLCRRASSLPTSLLEATRKPRCWLAKARVDLLERRMRQAAVLHQPMALPPRRCIGQRRAVAVRLLPFLFAVMTAAGTAAATPISAGTGPYTVDVVYDSQNTIHLYMDYTLDGVWHRTAITFKGAYDTANPTQVISSQLYCVDPSVSYYSNANISPANPDGTNNVWMAGYTVVAPSEIASLTAQNLNWNAISWLVVNGYQGDYASNDALSQASVAQLQNFLALTNPAAAAKIDKTIALIATKIAIWKITAGSRFQLNGVPPSVDKTVVDALVAALVDAAQNAPPSGVAATPSTSFTLTLNDSGAVLTSSGGYQYYGPITAMAELDNPNALLPPPPLSLDKIFLTVTGTDTTGIEFVRYPGGPSLPIADLYQTTTPASYIDGAGVALAASGAGVWRSGSTDSAATFYLKIPAARTLGSSGLTLDALAGIDDAPLTANPAPMVFIYEDNYQPDWNAIQPFVGMVTTDTGAFLYAEARLTRDAPPITPTITTTTTPVPALNTPSLLILALSVLWLGSARNIQRRWKQTVDSNSK